MVDATKSVIIGKAIQVSQTEINQANNLTITDENQLDLKVAYKLLVLQTRCKQCQWEFNLSFKRLKQLLRQKTCFYTGVEFSKDPNSVLRSTLDRVDSSIGYIDSNVVACTKFINNHKSNLTSAQIKQLYKGVLKFEKRIKTKAKSKSKTKAKLAKLTLFKEVKTA